METPNIGDHLRLIIEAAVLSYSPDQWENGKPTLVSIKIPEGLSKFITEFLYPRDADGKPISEHSQADLETWFVSMLVMHGLHSLGQKMASIKDDKVQAKILHSLCIIMAHGYLTDAEFLQGHDEMVSLCREVIAEGEQKDAAERERALRTGVNQKGDRRTYDRRRNL